MPAGEPCRYFKLRSFELRDRSSATKSLQRKPDGLTFTTVSTHHQEMQREMKKAQKEAAKKAAKTAAGGGGSTGAPPAAAAPSSSMARGVSNPVDTAVAPPPAGTAEITVQFCAAMPPTVAYAACSLTQTNLAFSAGEVSLLFRGLWERGWEGVCCPPKKSRLNRPITKNIYRRDVVWTCGGTV